MTREDFFRKIDNKLQIHKRDGWPVDKRAWVIFKWAQRMRSRVNPSIISDNDIIKHLKNDPEMANHRPPIEELVV